MSREYSARGGLPPPGQERAFHYLRQLEHTIWDLAIDRNSSECDTLETYGLPFLLRHAFIQSGVYADGFGLTFGAQCAGQRVAVRAAGDDGNLYSYDDVVVGPFED